MSPCDHPAAACWVVIPAYNESATVRDVAMRARQQCPYVIVVDDGSTDGTAGALAGLDVTLLRNEKNLGKAGSLRRGFDHALAQGAEDSRKAGERSALANSALRRSASAAGVLPGANM